MYKKLGIDFICTAISTQNFHKPNYASRLWTAENRWYGLQKTGGRIQVFLVLYTDTESCPLWYHSNNVFLVTLSEARSFVLSKLFPLRL